MTEKKLYRSRTDSMIAGVCGGLAEYFNVDSTLVRLAAVALTLVGGSGVLVYLILWFAVPQRPLEMSVVGGDKGQDVSALDSSGTGEHELSNAALFAGVLLVVLGFLFLIGNFISLAWLSFRKLWPLMLIAAGVVIVLRGSGRRERER